MGNQPPKAALNRAVLLNENADDLFIGGLVQVGWYWCVVILLKLLMSAAAS